MLFGGSLLVLKEFRWHGRGGQGAWTASELLARAAIHEGKYIQSFPEFGPERMGAPVKAYTRISDEPIRLHSAVYHPNLAIVMDPTLLATVPVTQGLSEDGILIINTTKDPKTIKAELNMKQGTVWTVPASEIAMRILGRGITNTAMLGVVARATGVVEMESIEKAVNDRFPEQLAEKNIGVIKEAYKEANPE
ncbi:MAG: 2-oxoacid:acceptor oxidoreductase family protein [Candidatus Bathyarchaeota archaeon]|jgi:2-oxoacid:acceptor oxidoreductase gamma subunit (pyruvate/2-ketoisovalerate family)|nr:2-oxoacid:acceptor oxidoreductase family protein [Candidatus Bathyarchaeota archaeon]